MARTGKVFISLKKVMITAMLAGVSVVAACAHVCAQGNTFAFSSSTDRMYVNGEYRELGSGRIPVLESGKTYLPLDEVLEVTGGSYSYDEQTQIATMITPYNDVWYTSTKLKTLYQQRDKITKSFLVKRSGGVFMEAGQLSRLLKMDMYTNDDVVVLTDSLAPDDRAYAAIKSRLYYERPDEARVISDLLANNPDFEHPRLFARKDDWDRIRDVVNTDDDAAAWYISLKKSADAMISTVPYRYEIASAGGILTLNQSITTRIQTLAFMWQVTRDEKYAERAYLEMQAVCDFPAWVPTGYLEIGQMMHAMAVGYDWLYDWMDESQRAYMSSNITERGMKCFIKSYDDFWSGRELSSARDWASWWTRIDSNWNPWVNSGAILVSLALGDEHPETAGYILKSALASLELCLDALAPDGASVEGIGYGDISTNHFVFAMAALDSALGTNYGYFNAPGFAGFAYFLNYMVGPVTAFNYHDSGTNTKRYFQNAFYVANKKADYPMAKLRLIALRDGQTAPTLFDLIWFKPGDYEDADTSSALDKYFRKAETGSMRSSYDDSNAIWLGFHGGGNNVTHAHLDSGTFVLDAMGANWACDLGTEKLTYESVRRYDDRWLLYRISPAGHNTLQINLNSDYGQQVQSFSPVTDYVSKAGGAYAIIDMTEAYSHVASSMRRGFMLTDSRKRVVIQDEIKLKNKSDIWWFMHTPAEIEVSGDGKTALLTQKGKTMRATMVEPANGTFYALEAKAMDGMPSNQYETPNTGIQKLAINVPDTAETNIMVELMPIYSDFDMSKEPLDYVSLDEWDVPNSIERLPYADNIYIDGEAIEGFDPDVVGYDIPIVVGNENIPVITAESKYDMEIVQPQSAGEAKAEVKLFGNDGELKNVYAIHFTDMPLSGLPKKAARGKLITATADHDDGSNGAKNVMDGDLSTRLSALDKVTLKAELEEPMTVTYVSLAFYSGNVRATYFDIELSEDGKNWTQVYSGQSSGTTEDFESYSVYPTRAKFIRINGHGNSLVGYDKGWNSISEMLVFGE